MDVDAIVEELRALGNPEKAAFKAKKFGVKTTNAFGIYQKDLNLIAKRIGKSSGLAIKLFETGWYDARILCSKLFPPKELTIDLMEHWIKAFDNWEICDAFCMGIFSKSQFAEQKIREWATREPEFEKRAAFATLSSYCMANKKAENAVYEAFFPLIEQAADDPRLYVKKAVNWALRSIGKRNMDLNERAIEVAYELLEREEKSAQWIAKDAIKELEKEGANILDYPRAIYRPKCK